MKNKGFTLVELSIVLVIIGLLVGGVLVGQSLIDSAKINRLVRDIQQYEVMVDQFESKFRSLPGDTSLFPVSGRGTAVANDGLIAQSNNTGYTFAATAPFYDSEVAYFWPHLSQAGISSINYTPSPGITTDIIAGTHAPSVLDDMALAIVSTSPTTANFFGIGGLVTTTQALAFDIKMDDGFASTLAGVTSIQDSGLAFLSKEIVATNALGACQTPSTLPVEYNISTSDKVCLVAIGFGRKR